MLCNNRVVASVIAVFVRTDEYAIICDFACVTPFASKISTRQRLVSKFMNSNAGWFYVCRNCINIVGDVFVFYSVFIVTDEHHGNSATIRYNERIAR